MARIDNLTNFLTDVSAAIKEKRKDSTPIPASQFDSEIMEIETAGTYQSKNMTVTQNGQFTIRPDSGYDALSDVNMNINVEGTPMEPTTADANDVFSPKTFYSNGQLMTGTVDVEWEEGDFTIPVVKTQSVSSIYILDYLPTENIVLYQTSTSAQTTLYIGILLANGNVEQKFSITKDQLIAMKTPSSAPKNIFSAAISRKPIINNVYNICITGQFSGYDNRPYYTIRLDIDNWTLYSDTTYDQCIYADMNDAWGAQPDMGYRIIPSNTNPAIFITYPTFPRTSGMVQGWQRIAKLTANAKSLALTNSNGLGNNAELRWGIFSEDGNYVFMSRAGNSSEGLYQVSNMSKLNTPSGMGCFLRNGTTNYMVVGNRTLRNMSNGQLADWSSYIASGFYYLFGHQNILYVFYSSRVDVFKVNFSGYSLTKLKSLTCSTSQLYSNTTYTRLIQVPYNVNNNVYSGYYGYRINTFTINELDQLPDVISTDNYKAYRARDDYDATAANILSGKKAVNKDGEVVGTMPNRTADEITPSTSSQYLPTGYYSGNLVKPVTSAIDINIIPENIRKDVVILNTTGTYEGAQGGDATSDANLQAKYLLTGYEAVADGQTIQGTMQNYGSTTITPTSSDIAIPEGYYLSLNIPVINAANCEDYTECSTALASV